MLRVKLIDEPTAIIISTHFNNLIAMFGPQVIGTIVYYLVNMDDTIYIAEHYEGSKALGETYAIARVLNNLIISYPDFDYHGLIKDCYLSEKAG